MKKICYFLLAICSVYFSLKAQATEEVSPETRALFLTTETDLQEWMAYLVSPECRGRLTGDIGFQKAAQYVADLFQEWGLEPGGDQGGYFQHFPHPYTEVQEMGQFSLYFPVGKDWIAKEYPYPDHYMVGGTSDSGELHRLELAYVGYGITAPELNYDDYKGIDVKGKIVVCDRDIPYQGRDLELQKKWTPYQYHNLKMTNAVAHGAAGMLYITTTANPNPGWNPGFIYASISDSVARDIFAGTGKNYDAVKEGINQSMKPHSFAIEKKADIKAVTQFHPDGTGCNVIGILRGTDPTLELEMIMAGAHLDHVGMMPVLMPGAMDNTSGSVIIMGAAKALSTSGYTPKRTLVFVLYGGEETGLIGSKYLVDHPISPLENLKVLFNIDCLGTGYGLGARAAQKYASLLDYVEGANEAVLKRPFATRLGNNEIIIRPRTDDANFFVKGVPTISLFSFGAAYRTPYHHPGDVMELIEFDIVRDCVKLLTQTMMDMGNAEKIEASSR
ncbi:MAG: M20/M25/M40 family metallo-hydrolase [Tannerellaceae bacterium]|nr:M20/M25/M40 family metallo-hydrolase [Tannerellaceae bacterium]